MILVLVCEVLLASKTQKAVDAINLHFFSAHAMFVCTIKVNVPCPVQKVFEKKPVQKKFKYYY